ncbi:SRPBCC family protein [Kineococcus aurantiacus]|uniref:SRPBCC family protein n=1 Tax=Kineococcus aurantiacus TaxID=37633 RepID=A0A7Y9DN65_9ACTN|nr:SRPBCC family protein [Kineococcus aurantiacus]NYD23696.1 hypothetical protein [Kineococcus aurantiacus]
MTTQEQTQQTLISAGDHTVPITVFARTSAPTGRTFEIIAPIDLTQVFNPVWPFPGVSSIHNNLPEWDRPGLSRYPQFDDGSQATETLTEYVEGYGFAYELTDFTNVLGQLAEGVRGEWSFLPDANGTMIRWTYEFLPKAGRRPILAGPFAPLWKRYMQRALDEMVKHVELTLAATGDR